MTAGVGSAVLLAICLCDPAAIFADSITLGSALSFAVLSGAGTSVVGSCCSVVSGNLGDYPSNLSSITGFPSSGTLLNGSFYASDQLPLIALQAQSDENAAYIALAGLPPTQDETGVTLGSGGTISTLLPGVYAFSSSAQVDGALTLDFNGESNAMFVFQVGTSLTTGSSAAIHVINADASDAIYWQVGTFATLGSSTTFAGNILAASAISLDPSASITCGRAFAQTASVTMAGTNFISDDCGLDNTLTGYSSSGPTDFASYGFSGQAAVTPEPGTLLLLSMGLAGVVAAGVKKR